MTRISLVLLFFAAISAAADAKSGAISFKKFCPEIKFNYASNRYEILIPLRVAGASNDFEVSQESLLLGKDSEISASILRESAASRILCLQCKTYQRCEELKMAIDSDATSFRRSVKFLSSSSASQTGVFARIPPLSLVNSNCKSGWKIFQQRIDGSLSFNQNYKTYERGFGNVKGNYWMGLHNLHAATAIGYSHIRCRLRVEAVGNDNKKYHAEFAKFEVQGPAYKYRLSVTNPVAGNTIVSSSILYHNQGYFTAYDRDNDKIGKVADGRSNCAGRHGFGGWWFVACHKFNPNGVYTRLNMNNYDYACFRTKTRPYQTLRRIKMMIKCN